jgi:transposase InsO family protein
VSQPDGQDATAGIRDVRICGSRLVLRALRPGEIDEEWREELKLLIIRAFEDSDGTYGYRRIWLQLARWGVHAGAELVRALMRELGLVACQPRPWRPSTTKQGQAGADPGPGQP